MSYFEEKKEPYEEGKSPIIEIGDDSDDAKEAVREEDEDEDPTVCDVCLIGEVYENNEILFCDKCNVAVHQLCYGVKTLPRDDDPWYCYPCAVGLDVTALKCELCCFTGGAYKYTDKAGKWAHSICANWIPEVYETHPENKPVFLNLKQLDPKRFRLKCSICSKKEGACIQCSYGRCTTSTHSWCALRNTAAGYTKRIVRDGEGGTLWEIFCKAHASAVSDPVKPKSKSKAIGNPTTGNASSSSSSKIFEEQPIFSASEVAAASSSSKKKKDKGSDDEGLDMKELLPVFPMDDSKSDSEEDSDQEENQTNFPVLNLIEWPGISEGDGMDTEHFWNVTLSYFPEDHSDKWLENMLNGPRSLTAELDKVLADHPITVNANTDQEDLDEISEELLASFGSEREQKHLLTYEKRDDTVQKIVDMLAKFESKSTEEVGLFLDKYYSEDFYLLKSCKLAESVVVNPSLSSNGCMELRAVFDGPEKRFAASFLVKYPASSLSEVRTLSKLGTWHLVDLNSNETDDLAKNILLPVIQEGQGMSEKKEDGSSAAVCLISMQPLADNATVKLTSQEIVAKDHDSELSRFIRIDQDVYQQLQTSIQVKINKLLTESDLLSVAAKNSKKKPEFKKVNTTYNRQQIWRRVASSLQKGVKDQSPDFNQIQEEAVPASWVIGREVPKDEEEEEEPHIDAVCMCCFDGTSDDKNQILFCDGCNATIHQYCYGVGEIPEGDYFCDRCMYLQKVAHSLEDDDLDEYDIKNSVKCVLCPVTHGGLKQSSDGQWIHLCCAFWAKEVVINNIQSMSSVDISQIPMTPVKVKSRRSLLFEANNGEVSESCCYCNYTGGFLRKCCHEEGNDGICSASFHPLCAWFHGDYMCSTITDPSFQGAERQGSYPSGIDFKFYCEQHSVLYRPNLNAVEEQKQLRNKYRINESDLNHIPGKDRKHKSKNKKKKKAGEGETRKTSSSQTPKVLGPDVYTEKVCAVCANPTSQDIFGSGYSPSSFDFISKELEEVELELSQMEDTVAETTNVEGNNVEKSDVEVADAAPQPPSSAEAVSARDPMEVVDLNADIAQQPTSAINREAVATNSLSSSKLATCSKCGIVVHRACLQDLNCCPVSSDPWMCEVCKFDDYEHVTCQLCPRKGGYFRHTTDNEWAHPYCARTVPGQISINASGDIDIRQVSKLAKKQKCMICNRKGGACVQCSSLGCVAYFHPLCAARSGKALVRSRHGVQTAYCSEHIPFGVELLSTGYWVDCNELLLLNSCLDRARIITDMLIRRDKHKKMICKAEMELFNIRFNKLLDRAKGKKSQASGDVDLSDLSLNGSDSEEMSDDDDFDGDDRSKQYIVLTDIKPPAHDDMAATVCTGEEVRISKHWSKKGEVKAPKILRLSFAGIEITKKDVQAIEGGIRTYQKAYTEIIRQVVDSSRGNTGIFNSAAEEQTFTRELAPSIIRHLKMSEKDYRKAMGLPEEDPKSIKKEKKVKKGYALVEDDVVEETPAEDNSPRKRSRARRDSEEILPSIVKVEDAVESKRLHKRKSAAFEEIEEEEPVSPNPSKRGRRSSIKVASLLEDDTEDVVVVEESKKSRKSLGKNAAEVKEEVKEKKASTEEIQASLTALYQAVQSTASKPACKEVMKFFTQIQSAGNTKSSRNRQATAVPLDAIAEKVVLDNEHLDASEWTTYGSEDLYRLERIIQVVLNNITQYRIMDSVKSPNGKKSPRKKGRGRPKIAGFGSQEGRSIEDDFEDIPYDLIPDYNSFVRRIVTMSSIRKRLHSHGYNSLASFSNDFYTMLNNARQVTISSSQTWKDTKLFAKLFEEYKKSAFNDPKSIQTRVQEFNLNIVPAGARFTSSNHLTTPSKASSSNSNVVPENCGEVSILCGCCKTSYVVYPWPSEFAIPEKFDVSTKEPSAEEECMPTRRSVRSTSTPSSFTYTSPGRSAKKGSTNSNNLTNEWQWLCESCLSTNSKEIIGSEVKVWWHDDACAYSGVVNAFDPESDCYRVLYEDNEWEFIQFTQEVYLIKPNV